MDGIMDFFYLQNELLKRDFMGLSSLTGFIDGELLYVR